MARPTGIPITTFAQARKMRAAERLSEAVKKPAILTLAQVQAGLERLQATRVIYVQFCGDDDKCVQFATVSQLRNALKQVEYPLNTPLYLRSKEKKQAFNAWPIIWQGAVGKKYILVAYVDPVRYGFKSRAKALLTIGPPTPMSIDRRKNGFWISRDPKTWQPRFDPILDGEDGASDGKVRKPIETLSARKLTFRYGHHWREVLQSYVEPAARTKGQQQQFQRAQVPSRQDAIRNPTPTGLHEDGGGDRGRSLSDGRGVGK